MTKRIAVIGPESTGKSTLCTDLARHYNGSWVPEYAREYLSLNGLNYTFDDLLVIAQRQVQLEDNIASQKKGLVFVDTNLYVMKVWCEFVFEKCHQWILNEIALRKYDLYLLCNIDLPWEFDDMREYPDLPSRERLFHMYRDLMINQQVPWKLISGTNTQRLQEARSAVDSLISATITTRSL